MMRQYELVERVAGYIDDPDEALLNKAYVYAMQKHGEQKRASGDPYFSHPLEVAAILTDLHLDEETIAVALLHDTLEDTDATRQEIDKLFGNKIGLLVDGLTKLKRLDLVSQKAKQAENLRRLLLAISNDVRVLLVKLADRLHNMRTLDHMRDDKKVRIATETMEIYAPLAGRMGMQDLRDELEMLSFKMESKALGFEQLSDIFGFRVIVDTVEACYQTLGIIHTDWRMVPGRFKDFISLPKQNGYQSIHTTVVGPSRQRVELQIRTVKMNEVAEYGIAAHTAYKDGEDAYSDNKAYASLRKTIEQLAEADNPEEFLEHTKLELFLDQVFCFTPKGQIIALPTGATPIDFAYAVHTDIGNTCIGCKLNGKIMPLVTELNNGDEVEILRSDAQSPPAAWEAIVATGKARSSIRRASRLASRMQFSAFGVRILERVFDEAGKKYASEKLESALPRLARESVEDVTAEVGRNEMPALDVLKAVYPDFELSENDNARPVKPSLAKTGKKTKHVDAERPHFPIRGVRDDLPIHFPEVGGAVPGDPIVGVMEEGLGIVIYHSDAPALAELRDQNHQLMDVRWDIDSAKGQRFLAKIGILSAHAPGTLATISQVIAEFEGNIQNLNLQVLVDDFAEMQIDVEVWDASHLTRIIKHIGDKSVVTRVLRKLE